MGNKAIPSLLMALKDSNNRVGYEAAINLQTIGLGYDIDSQARIKELLTQLQAAIEADSNLNDDDKTEALEQVKVITEARQNPMIEPLKKTPRQQLNY